MLQAVVSVLLAAGAKPNASLGDALAGCALLAAVRKGHDAVISQLVSAGAKLQLPAGELSCALCSAVAVGDGQLLRRYIAAGADASVCDYNGQTPLHVAASQGKLDLVRGMPCSLLPCLSDHCCVSTSNRIAEQCQSVIHDSFMGMSGFRVWCAGYSVCIRYTTAMAACSSLQGAMTGRRAAAPSATD
jgi:ankyrin repeat protein